MAAVPSVKAESIGDVRGTARLPPRDVQELWFAVRRREWKSLALVSSVPQMSVLPLAESLAEVAALIHGGPLRVRRTDGIDVTQIASLIVEMSGREPTLAWTPNAPRVSWAGGGADDARREGPLIVAVGCVVAEPLLLPVALAADAAVLCVAPGATDLEVARHSIELIGRDRFIGSVIVDRR